MRVFLMLTGRTRFGNGQETQTREVEDRGSDSSNQAGIERSQHTKAGDACTSACLMGHGTVCCSCGA